LWSDFVFIFLNIIFLWSDFKHNWKRPVTQCLMPNCRTDLELTEVGSFDFYSVAKTGVNFINVLRTAFTLVDPKSVKRNWQLDWILTLLGATGVKAVHKYVGEIEPWCQFHQCFTGAFFVRKFVQSQTLKQRKDFCTKNVRVKLMLMKLTTGGNPLKFYSEKEWFMDVNYFNLD